VYDAPGFVTVTIEIAYPPGQLKEVAGAITAVAVAPEPPPPENAILGGVDEL
jgi:hypothetical protein